MRWELRRDDKLPDAETEEKKNNGHCEDAEPFVAASGTLSTETVVTDVFGEIGPVCLGGIGETAFTIACFKALQPERFVESQGFQITADESLSEDPARQFAEVAGLDVEQLAHRELRRRTHRLQRDTAVFPLLP